MVWEKCVPLFSSLLQQYMLENILLLHLVDFKDILVQIN